ncbi:hypothetical protein BJ944DRAFT_273185 [Cunninghamella echinulata]|nr:hypothetical protein BJ944DRAFT_273185 [Cunninghamella echinulata]
MIQLKYLTTTSIIAILSTTMTTMVSAGGIVGQVASANDFCVFLPPPGTVATALSDFEWNSEAYCMGNTPKAVEANKLPDGFIQSAHYVITDEYVQVTGQIDPTKAGLNPMDEGGQCDIVAPKGSSCVGWNFYVNLIEPANNIFCMRCCNDPVNCNRGISQYGCNRVVPGDYSGPLLPGSNNNNSSSAVITTTTAVATSTTTTTAVSSTNNPSSSKTDPLGGAASSLSNTNQPTVVAQSENIAVSTSLSFNPSFLGVLLFIAYFYLSV